MKDIHNYVEPVEVVSAPCDMLCDRYLQPLTMMLVMLNVMSSCVHRTIVIRVSCIRSVVKSLVHNLHTPTPQSSPNGNPSLPWICYRDMHVYVGI